MSDFDMVGHRQVAFFILSLPPFQRSPRRTFAVADRSHPEKPLLLY